MWGDTNQMGPTKKWKYMSMKTILTIKGIEELSGYRFDNGIRIDGVYELQMPFSDNPNREVKCYEFHLCTVKGEHKYMILSREGEIKGVEKMWRMILWERGGKEEVFWSNRSILENKRMFLYHMEFLTIKLNR